MYLPRFALLTIVAASVLAADPAEAPTPTVRGGLPGYDLTWQDEFATGTVDTTRWSFRTDPSIWSAQQRQNVAVADGNLLIHLRKEDVAGKAYTGGGVISKATFRGGFFEARLRIPAGAGWHTSFRLSMPNAPEGASGISALREVSLFENDSITGNRSMVLLSVMAGKKANAGGKTVTTEGLATDFHVFGAEFTDRLITFYRDGEVQQVVDLTHLSVKDAPVLSVTPGDYRLWFSCVAANLGGTTAVDDAKLPATLAIDYVRVFAAKL